MMSSSKDAEANSNAYGDFQTSESTVTVTHESALTRTKSLLDAYILLLPLGFFGAHHFYLNRTGWGFLYLFTFGLCGLGWLLDLFRMPYLVKGANYKLMYPDCPVEKSRALSDTWIIAFFPMTGLLGFHHYYLGRIGWGVLYTCTVGLCGLGWVFDNIRMPLLVKRANMKMCEGDDGQADKCYKLDDVYVIAFNPFGVLGFHHFYLKRYGWGMLYLFTVGVFGVGWLVDLCRMKMLVDQKNLEICHNNSAYYHSSTPNYGATIPQEQEPQYQPHPYYSKSHGYEPTPGAGDYQPGPPSYQPPNTYPVKSEHPVPPDGNQYPPPTNPGYPTASPPPPY